MKTVLWIVTAAVFTFSNPAFATPAAGEQQLASTMALAESGDPVAVNRLGAWYEKGINVEVDLVRAALLYRQAAQSGNAIAQNNLGVLYNRGAGVALDKNMAVYWYAKAAEQGHAWAQANLAYAYEHGTAGERDIDKAQYWLMRSAEGGLADAQVRLGVLLMSRASHEAERADAAAWLARAAAQDFAPGLYYLGRSFELGLGNVQDDDRAAALYRQAMRSRHPAAFYRYGVILERRGDEDLAAAAFRQGAVLGDCRAALRSQHAPPTSRTSHAAVSGQTELSWRTGFCGPLSELAPGL